MPLLSFAFGSVMMPFYGSRFAEVGAKSMGAGADPTELMEEAGLLPASADAPSPPVGHADRMPRFDERTSRGDQETVPDDVTGDSEAASVAA